MIGMAKIVNIEPFFSYLDVLERDCKDPWPEYRTLMLYEIRDSLEALDEIVRCRECKNRGTNLCPMETVELYPWFATDDNGFCNYGLRK